MRPLDDFEQRIVDDVDNYGWFGLSVAPRTDSDEPEEWFTYTIGLPKSHGWPEIIVFGLSKETSHSLLTDAIAECEARTEIPRAGLELREVIKGFPAKLVDGSRIADHYFGFASWYARYVGTASPPERVQLFWPDKNGIFPDDPSCNEEVRHSETPLEVN